MGPFAFMKWFRAAAAEFIGVAVVVWILSSNWTASPQDESSAPLRERSAAEMQQAGISDFGETARRQRGQYAAAQLQPLGRGLVDLLSSHFAALWEEAENASQMNSRELENRQLNDQAGKKEIRQDVAQDQPSDPNLSRQFGAFFKPVDNLNRRAK